MRMVAPRSGRRSSGPQGCSRQRLARHCGSVALNIGDHYGTKLRGDLVKPRALRPNCAGSRARIVVIVLGRCVLVCASVGMTLIVSAKPDGARERCLSGAGSIRDDSSRQHLQIVSG